MSNRRQSLSDEDKDLHHHHHPPTPLPDSYTINKATMMELLEGKFLNIKLARSDDRVVREQARITAHVTAHIVDETLILGLCNPDPYLGALNAKKNNWHAHRCAAEFRQGYMTDYVHFTPEALEMLRNTKFKESVVLSDNQIHRLEEFLADCLSLHKRHRHGIMSLCER